MYHFWAAPRTPHPATSGHSSNRAIQSRSGPIPHGGRTIPVQVRSITVRFTAYSFGSVCVDGVAYDHDLIIDRGKIRKRKKAASKKFRGGYGHTPAVAAEDILWRCRRLVIGTGAAGALPVSSALLRQIEATRRGRTTRSARTSATIV